MIGLNLFEIFHIVDTREIFSQEVIVQYHVLPRPELLQDRLGLHFSVSGELNAIDPEHLINRADHLLGEDRIYLDQIGDKIDKKLRFFQNRNSLAIYDAKGYVTNFICSRKF